MSDLKLGIIGLSEGNGHPYSWSAIFNGYDPDAMADCPFPAIPAYLARQSFPDDALPGAQVTHVWTQDRTLSEHVARAARIEHVVDHAEAMIGQVDAILLARDDSEHHLAMSAPFLAAGLPLYIDKPIATRLSELDRILALQHFEGQVFTCSALQFAREFRLTDSERAGLGALRYVDACVMKSWERYGVHIIEPVLRLIGDQGGVREVTREVSGDLTQVRLSWSSGLVTSLSALGATASPIAIRLFGSKGYRVLTFEDTYFAFKEALRSFLVSIETKTPPIAPSFVREVVSIIERGCGAT